MIEWNLFENWILFKKKNFRLTDRLNHVLCLLLKKVWGIYILCHVSLKSSHPHPYVIYSVLTLYTYFQTPLIEFFHEFSYHIFFKHSLVPCVHTIWWLMGDKQLLFLKLPKVYLVSILRHETTDFSSVEVFYWINIMWMYTVLCCRVSKFICPHTMECPP